VPKFIFSNILSEQFLFRSKDLAHWDYLHEFVEGDRFTLVGDDGACPYFWPIGDRYILPFFSHMTGGQYLLGDYDKVNDKFIATNSGKFNFGASTPSGVHAPSATPDGKGGVIILFNMNPGKATQGWNMIMTLPRRLTLRGKEEINMEPAGDFESLRYNHEQVVPMILPRNKEVVLKNIRGNAMEFVAEIDTSSAPVIELDVLRSPRKEEYTRILFYRERGNSTGRNYVPVHAPATARASLISLETSSSSELRDVRSRAPETAPVLIGVNEPLKLHVFIDRSVVEVFVNGKQCVATRVYPGRDDSMEVSLRSQGSDTKLISLDAWQMKNIYGQ
jgi:beta-fructofuranosidase